jgi:hypothetical protein
MGEVAGQLSTFSYSVLICQCEGDETRGDVKRVEWVNR